MAAAAKLLRGQPASGPQLNEGEPNFPPRYHALCARQSQLEYVAGNSDGMASDATVGGVATPPSSHGSPPMYPINDGDCPRSLPIQRPIRALQFHGTPPPSDDGVVPSSIDSLQSMTSSPPKKAAGKSALNATSRVVKVPRVRRRGKRDSTEKDPLPDIPGPLSEVTKHMTHIPVKDMKAYVHRPIVERHIEVERRKKKNVSRPMNSFMLYRSAYTDRTKALLHLKNHQEVSRVSGKSWGMETPFIRMMYEELADIEKENHCRAHPYYKFAPKKESEPKKKRRADDGDYADLDDVEFAPEPLPPHVTQSWDSDVDSNYSNFDSRGSTPFDNPIHGFPTSGSILTWQTTLSGEPEAGMMAPAEQSYLQTSIRPGPMGAHVEDVFGRAGYPDMPCTPSSELTGLPGASHYALMQPQTPGPANSDGQLDPRLLMHGSESPAGASPFHQPNYHAWHEPQGNNAYLPIPTSVPQSPAPYPMTSGAFQHPGMQPIMDHGDCFDSSHDGLDAPGGPFEMVDHPTPGY